MFCLLNACVTWDQYFLAFLHYGAITSVVYGVVQLIKEGRQPVKSG